MGTTRVAGEGGTVPVSALSGVARRDWDLYSDWCTATGRDPYQGGWADLAAMLTDLPASTAVQDRRVRHIRRALGYPPGGLPRPAATLRSRIGPDWASYPDALAALRHEWWPEGVAARRDALIIVLIARGFTRARIRRLRPPDVEVFPESKVGDCVLDQHPDPVLCPGCALARWLQVLDAFRHRSGRDVEELLTTARAYHRPIHDCVGDVGEGWKTAAYLIPPVDQHAAIALGPPISIRALTAVLRRRFTLQPVTPAAPPTHAGSSHFRDQGRRPTRIEQEHVGRLYERIEAETDALNARIRALLDDLSH